MKTLKKIIQCILVGAMSVACNFLDITPDEIATEKDAFKNFKAAEGFMYSCYSYLPQPNSSASLDLMTGDEVVTAFEHETFAHFPKGNFTAANPVISYWNTLFQGIKQCYILKNNINNVPDIDNDTKNDYIAQADFLIGYYHFLLIRSYGPVILVKEEPKIDTPAELFLPRTNFDECVAWVTSKLDDAANRLPATRTGNEYGLVTSMAAKAIKARLLLYAASPLFNGNTEYYSNFRDVEGNPLMSLSYDANKWQLAKIANKEAIDLAETGGVRLYAVGDAAYPDMPEPKDPVQRALRFTIVDRVSSEFVWAETRTEGAYSLQNKARPWWAGTWNGVAPTMTMVDRFYTENGLPIDQDPAFDYQNRFNTVAFAPEDRLIKGEGETQLMHLKREPRYYAWLSFHNGYYECRGNAPANSTNNNNNLAYLPKYKKGESGAKILTQFLRNDNCGRRDRNNNYSPTGMLVKKGVRPDSESTGSIINPVNYPWPIVRLGELYLNYAEACVETNDLAEAITYINKIRVRAGIPTLQDAWGAIGVTLSQDKLREIVRQERQIELFLENHNFWDMRRWKLAHNYFGQKVRGFDTLKNNLSEFSREVELENIVRNFNHPTHYLMPIPSGEINKNTKMVQNPGY